MNTYTFVQYYDTMKIPDGVYNSLYNKEPALIRIKESHPVFVQFIDQSSIYDVKGIMNSNVELLIPSQKI